MRKLIKKYQTPSDPIISKPELDKISFREDGSAYWKDKDGNIWPLQRTSDTEFVRYDTEGNVANKFNISSEAVKAVKPYDASDMDEFFGNLILPGIFSQLKSGGENIAKGNYKEGLNNYLGLALFGPGAIGNILRFGYGAYHLLNEDGIPKTFGLALGSRNDGVTGNRAVDTGISLFGDLLNAGIGYSGSNGLIRDLAESGNKWAKGYTVGKALSGDINATRLVQQNPYVAWGAPVTFRRTAEVPRITAENMAGKTTDSWEAAYSKALNNGDVAEQQRLISLRFANDAPNSVTVNNGKATTLLHGTHAKGWTEYDPTKFGTATDSGTFGEGLYLTKNRRYATEYATSRMGTGDELTGEVKELYTDIENPFYVDMPGISEEEYLLRQDAANQFGRPTKSNDYLLNHDDISEIPSHLINEADSSDGIIQTLNKRGPVFDEVVIKDPWKIKSAAPATYDNNGWTIPITERFHFGPKDVDIRGRGWFGESIAQQNAQAMRQSSRILDAKGIEGNISNIKREVQPVTGKITLSLPSHTTSNPRQIVLEPQDNNKFFVHMRIWDGEKVPGAISQAEKQQLFDALYDELPEGAEILFPESSPTYRGTRGTVAGLMRLGRDKRFTPGTKGTLYYEDKNGALRTFEGTSFIKKSQSKVLDSKGIGEANPQTVVRTGHTSLSDPDNPFQIRRTRLNNKFIGDYDPNTQKLVNKVIVRNQDIRKVFKELDPSLSDDELDLAVQTAFASRRGVHVPIGDNSGQTIGGVSVVDIKETLKYLRESGIINPNAEDVGTVVAHEIGHGVKVNKAAMNLVKDYSNPNEFYTLVGQILDYGKVTKNEEISFNRLMKLTDKYLHDKKLDNGITELKEYLSNYPMSQRKDLMKAIGRFSAGLFGAYLIKNRNKNGKIQ